MRMVFCGTSRLHTPAFMLSPGTSAAGRTDPLANRRMRQLLAHRAANQAKLDHLRAHRPASSCLTEAG